MKSFLETIMEKEARKASSKLSSLFEHEGTLIPDSEVVEQASGELAAGYTAELLEDDETVADLTAGLGGNTFFFSKKARKVYSVEIDPRRASCLKHNLEVAGVKNVEVINSDCIEWIKNSDLDNLGIDTFYIDPSRRSTSKKVLRLADCRPDATEIFNLLQGKIVQEGNRKLPSKRLIIKASPLLDIRSIIVEFPSVRCIHILEVNREVKEILIEIPLYGQHKETADTDITDSDMISLKCVMTDEYKTIKEEYRLGEMSKNACLSYIESGKELNSGHYIYEPSPAMMKAGMFGCLSERFGKMKKLAPSTHLFYSRDLFIDFPGRIFKVKSLTGSGELKKMKGAAMNVISRNHPARASEIESRFKLKSSEYDYLIACTAGKDKVLILCEKISAC